MALHASMSRARRGLTLIELLVVLVVLVAIGGIAVQTLPGMLQRTHFAVCSTNIGEVAKAIQMFEQVNLSQPNDWDSLVDASDELFGGLPADANGPLGGQVAVHTLTEDEAALLNDAGITHVWSLVNTANPTFGPYGTRVALEEDAAVVEITDTTAKEEVFYARNAGDRFILFGLGARTNLIGNGIMEPPTHFSDAGGQGAGRVYGRYGVVYQIARGGNLLPQARFRAVVALHDIGIENVDSHIGAFWEMQESAD